jgi:hypothetical protein
MARLRAAITEVSLGSPRERNPQRTRGRGAALLGEEQGVEAPPRRRHQQLQPVEVPAAVVPPGVAIWEQLAIPVTVEARLRLDPLVPAQEKEPRLPRPLEALLIRSSRQSTLGVFPTPLRPGRSALLEWLLCLRQEPYGHALTLDNSRLGVNPPILHQTPLQATARAVLRLDDHRPRQKGRRPGQAPQGLPMSDSSTKSALYGRLDKIPTTLSLSIEPRSRFKLSPLASVSPLRSWKRSRHETNSARRARRFWTQSCRRP